MDPQFKKRKRTRSVLSQAKKLSRKGCWGRGTYVDEETYQYFLKIYEMNFDDFETEEEKIIFANNALKQTEEQEVHLSLNQFISRVIEKLLPFSSEENISKFMSTFSNLRVLCTDNFASHVVQTLVKVCAERYRERGDDKYFEFVKRISLFIFNNLEEFIYDPYANQIGRCCLQQCLGSEGQDPLSVEIIENLSSRILKWPSLNFIVKKDMASGFMQVLLTSLSKTNAKLTQKMVKKIFRECFVSEDYTLNKSEVQSIFESMPATRLLETIIQVSAGKRYTLILNSIFISRLAVLSCNRRSFISVQKLISSCQDSSEYTMITSELMPHFEDIIYSGSISVILELAKAVLRLKSAEGDFLKSLKGALKSEHSSCGELVTKLLYIDTDRINMYGSLLVQTLLQFKKPIAVVENILSVDSKDLKKIFLDPKGCYLVDAYVSSKTIGEKSRERLLQKLKGHYKDLVQDKFGSRVVEALWSRASIKDKHFIMAELDRSVCRTQFGSIIASKFHLDLYLSDKGKWASTVSKMAAKILTDIVS